MKLRDILTQEQEAAGLLVYDDEDMVYLNYGEKALAMWSARSVTPAHIQNEAQNTLARMRQMKPVAFEFYELQLDKR